MKAPPRSKSRWWLRHVCRRQSGSRYATEVFTNDDGGSGTFWVTAKSRAAHEALAIVERVAGPADGWTVEKVYGDIRDEGNGPEVFFDDNGDGDVELWAVEA